MSPTDADRPVTVDPGALRDEVLELGRSNGLVAVGTCDAAPFHETRVVLEERRAAGLNSDMAFTYRNPARSTDPSATLQGARSMVVGAYRYDTEIPPQPDRPTARVARYATTDHYAALRSALDSIADLLRSVGHRAIVVADDNAMVDRAVAVRAGLGWYGKNSNVLLPGHGSWVVLGSVITDADLPPSGAPIEDGCGPCRRCLDGCPTGAIIAAGVVDARRCLAWHVQSAGEFPREFRRALGDRIYGCDDCQEVCPPSRRADVSDATDAGAPGAPPASVADPGRWVDLEWLLTAPDEELMGHVGRWYVPKRDPRYLRRNALVVFGNTVDPSDEPMLALLDPYLDGADDLLAGHAAWAAIRIGRRDLLEQGDRSRRAAIVAELDVPTTASADDDGGR